METLLLGFVTFVIIVIFLGVIFYLVENHLPMSEPFKVAIRVIVVIFVIVLLLALLLGKLPIFPWLK